MKMRPCLQIISSVYFCATVSRCVDPPTDPQLPSLQDLLVADPSRNITCLGDKSDIGWNLRLENYDGRSMQKLCADPLYGGSDATPNLRGYCQNGDVFFSSIAGLADRWTQLKGLRSYLECRNRCFCNDGLPDPLQQPKEVAETRKTFVPPNRHSRYTISVDRRTSAQGRWPNLATRIYSSSNNPNDLGHQPGSSFAMHVQFEDVGILPSNMISCGGPLPDFPLPPPFDGHDFATNQALCAVQLSGGNPAANAGGYCHRIEPLSTGERVVAFADDMTPRLDWTWSGTTGASFFHTASIRFHCWKNCICRDRTRKKNYMDPQVQMWEWLVENLPDVKDLMSFGTGNRYPMGSSTDAKGKTRTSARGGNQRAAECADTQAPTETCAIPWPFEILGPVPKELLKFSPPKPPAIAGWDANKACGNQCSGNGDCGSDCLCRRPSVEEAKTLGVDPVVPLAMCLDIGSVFGRSLEGQVSIECLCNTTYIASECCHSRDGIVHDQSAKGLNE